jgi:hypothetical protein
MSPNLSIQVMGVYQMTRSRVSSSCDSKFSISSLSTDSSTVVTTRSFTHNRNCSARRETRKVILRTLKGGQRWTRVTESWRSSLVNYKPRRSWEKELRISYKSHPHPETGRGLCVTRSYYTRPNHLHITHQQLYSLNFEHRVYGNDYWNVKIVYCKKRYLEVKWLLIFKRPLKKRKLCDQKL